MTAANPTIREDLNIATPQRISDLLRDVFFGDLLIQLLWGAAANGGKTTQSARVVQAGASPFAVTWAGLGLRAPSDAALVEIAVNGINGDERVDLASVTTTGFSIVGGADTETLEIIAHGRWQGAPPVMDANLAVAANAATLASIPKVLLDVVAQTGTTPGRKTLLIGGADVVPATGEVVWDGKTGLRFAAADAVTRCAVLFLTAASDPALSKFSRTLGQQDR